MKLEKRKTQAQTKLPTYSPTKFEKGVCGMSVRSMNKDDIYKCIIVSINRSLTTEERIKEMKNKFNKKIKKYNLKGGQKSKKRISSYFNGRIIYDGINNKTIYYQDLKNIQWVAEVPHPFSEVVQKASLKYLQ